MRGTRTLLLVCAGALALAGAAGGSAEAAAPPQVLAAWVTDVTTTAATLHGEIETEGLHGGYRFQYLGEPAYEENLADGGDGFAGAASAPVFGEAGLGEEAGPQPVQQQIERLSPGTAYRYRLVSSTAAGTAAGPALRFSTQPSATTVPDSCPNAQLRAEDGSSLLPDCRAYERVTPSEETGGAEGPGTIFGGGVFQAAAGGGALTFSAGSSFGPGAAGAPPASQYLGRRGGGGWEVENVSPAFESGAYPDPPDGVPYQLFDPDLSRGLMFDGGRCGAGESCPVTYSLRSGSGALLASSPAAPGLRFAGAEAGLGAVVLSTCAALTADATEAAAPGGGCEPAATNLYEWGGGAPVLINLLPGESHGTPGARLAAQGGAVSAGGQRIYFTLPAAGPLYLREAGGPTKLLPYTSGGASFQIASADGAFAFFTAAGTLYRYSAASEASTPIASGVRGVLGASDGGAVAYYQTAAGLFRWSEGTATEVAAGPEAAAASDYPPTTGTARVSADGSQLAFLSREALAGYDSTDQETGEADPELFLYDAGAGQLRCVSCNPTGARPLGPTAIPGAVANGTGSDAADVYKPRVLAAGGRRLFFDSADRLVPRDSSAAADVYEWEVAGEGGCTQPQGCVSLISSGRGAQGSEFIDASADGGDAFFLTTDSLLGSDGGSPDIYDAREFGGLPQPQAPTPCEGDACQPLPAVPEDPSPGTLVSGQGNPSPRYRKVRRKRHRRAKHHHHRHHVRHGGGR